MKSEKNITRTGPVVLDYSTKPATVVDTTRIPDDNLPELRHLLGPGRTESTIRAAFVIRLKRKPVAAEVVGLLSFSADVSAERLLAEIDVMGEVPITTLADVQLDELRFPGE